MNASMLASTADQVCALCRLWMVRRDSRGRAGLCKVQTISRAVDSLGPLTAGAGAHALLSGAVLAALRDPANHVTTGCGDTCPRWESL